MVDSPRDPFKIIKHDYRKPLSIGGEATIVLADPPYNQGVEYAGDRTGDNLCDGEYRDLCAMALRQHAEWLDPGGTCWWVVQPWHVPMLAPLMSAIIGPCLYWICWYEKFSNYNRFDLTKDWRSILVHARDPKMVDKYMDEIRVPSDRLLMKNARGESRPDKRADKRGRIPGTVWPIRRLQGTSTSRVKWHKAQLPPELHQRILKGWSRPGDLVVDGFAGSGSMGVEAIKLGRPFVGIERSAEYCKKIRTRLRAVEKGLS